MDATNEGFLGSILAWVKHPFDTQGSAVRWILFVGLLIIAVFFWQLILLEILPREGD